MLISWIVTPSSCLIWQIISFILSPNEYVCVYIRLLTEDADFDQKKIIFPEEAHFDFGGYAQAQLSHLRHKKPARIHWKTHALKTSHCLVRILVQRPLQSMAIVIRPCWMNFCSQKLKRRILATFGFNRTAIRVIQLTLHSMFWALFLKITLSAADLMSFDYLGAAIWHRWTIICGVPSKISVTPTSQRQLTI